MSTRLRLTFLAAAVFLGISGCTPHTDLMAGWRDLGTFETLEKSSPGTIPDAIKQDVKAYFRTNPPDNPPDEEYMGPMDRYLEDGTGQHSVVVEVPREGERWQYALIYDRNNRRIKVLKYSVGGYQS